MGLSRVQKTLRAKGFSLIELMVAVSIMGVLVAIAVPQYQRSQARAFHAGAQSALSTLYMHEQNFYYEWDVYVGSFGPLDFTPTGTYYYDLGFHTDDRGLCGSDAMLEADMTIGALCVGGDPDFPQRKYTGRVMGGNKITIAFACEDGKTCEYLGEGHKSFAASPLYASVTSDGLVTTREFAIPAVGMTPVNGSEEYDFWAINHYKVICHKTLGDEHASDLTGAKEWLGGFVNGMKGCKDD